MNEETTIREAKTEDIDAMLAIERAACELFKHLPEVYARFIVSPTKVTTLQKGIDGGTLWVAQKGDAVVGFALAFERDGALHLDEIDVHPEHGRKGLGRRMIEHVFAYARSRQFTACTLSTMTTVPWNAPFYRTMGFRELSDDALTPAMQRIRESEIAHGIGADRVIMRCDLVADA